MSTSRMPLLHTSSYQMSVLSQGTHMEWGTPKMECGTPLILSNPPLLVAHLSLRAREREKNGGALHSALHPSFDRAAMCSNLAYQLPVITNRADTGRAFPNELWEEVEGSAVVREGGFAHHFTSIDYPIRSRLAMLSQLRLPSHV